MHLAIPDSTSALLIGGILNSEIRNKNYKNVNSMAPDRLQKGYLFTVWEQKQEGRALPC